MGLFAKDKSTQMSMPQSRMVHGVEIKKAPVGQYIQAMKGMEELPTTLMHACFPDKTLEDVVDIFRTVDEEEILPLLSRCLVSLPEHLIMAVCDIIGLDKGIAMNKLTPKELMDVFCVFWEVNELSDFFKNVWELLKKKLPTQNTGYKNGLQ